MRLLHDWQYKYIEKCLFNYRHLKHSHLPTERLMAVAIDGALEFFNGKQHAIMIEEYYFNAAHHRRTKTQGGHFQHVCRELLFTEPSNGWVVRREIVYRIAMHCYALGVFKLK